MSTTGLPPRPPLLLSCGPSAAISSVTDPTPSARISCEESVVSGWMSPTTDPGSLRPLTTTSSSSPSSVPDAICARAESADQRISMEQHRSGARDLFFTMRIRHRNPR